jgi:hypothetical protein
VSVTVNNVVATCPCSLFAPTDVPATIDSGDTRSIEVGMKFTADTAGSVTAIRFYKAAANAGSHTGTLWSNAGKQLATVTFANETASGWQQATLSAPVALTAGKTYVVSYHATSGHYSTTAGFFTTSLDRPPLHAPASGSSGGNGVYRYGSKAFPKSSTSATNYWVDVVFSPASQLSAMGFSAATSAASLTSKLSTAAPAVAASTASPASPEGTRSFVVLCLLNHTSAATTAATEAAGPAVVRSTAASDVVTSTAAARGAATTDAPAATVAAVAPGLPDDPVGLTGAAVALVGSFSHARLRRRHKGSACPPRRGGGLPPHRRAPRPPPAARD